ncbi:MAG: glycosyltransferase family 4 protein [Okeania sp. SIO3B3]|nr:glycosyltransferase family 4 protein [Okeania sp. SIO3B3]
MAEQWNWPRLDYFRAFANGPIIFSMTGAIAKHPAEVVAASSFPFLHMHYALRGAHRSNKPMILHGALHPTDPRNFDHPMIYKAIKKAEAYIANSRYERDYLLDHDIPADKIQVVGVGVNIEDFVSADGASVRRAHGWGDSPVIGFIGQLTERKGVDQLLQAMPQVWQPNPDVKVLLAGASTSYLDAINKQVEALPHPNQVVIKPDFPETEKASLFAACDMIVFPSMEESFGIVFLEAWASHKPVIGLRCGAIPTVVTDTVDGLLVEANQPKALAQAILALLANPDRRHKMGEDGLSKVKQHYTWDIVTSKFRAIYQAQVSSKTMGKRVRTP